MPNQPIFSILHTSVRPNEWEKVYRSWLDNARYPLIVEYVLVVDHDWGFDELPIKLPWNAPLTSRLTRVLAVFALVAASTVLV